MSKRSETRARIPFGLLSVVLVLNVAIIGVLAYWAVQFRDRVVVAHERGGQALEMVLATYTLRQSSDYLTRFARRYAVTADPAWRDVYQQVLDIRRGDALRPKDYESVYWDLIEPYRSNAHPLLYPQSLRSILEGLPFSPEELDLLQQAEDNSEALAQLELRAFQAVEEGRRQEAIDALFSVDYLRAKHTIMQPIDELMVRVRNRIEAEREASLARDDEVVDLVIGALGVMAVVNLLLLIFARRRPARDRCPEEVEEPVGEAGGQAA